jgi:ubiquitin-conjugating enzyme E2 T
MQSKRLARELKNLALRPPAGAVCYPIGDSLNNLEAKLQPIEGTPYEGGVFTVSIVIGERYPHEPPNVRFVTPVYHPNIDSEGRICLNLLKMPPKGVWSPAYDIGECE